MVSSGKMGAKICILVATLLVSATRCGAQDTEIAGGVSWLWVRGDYGRWLTYPGWSVELARGVTTDVSVVVEVRGNYRSVDYPNGWNETHRVYLIAGGPKLVTSRRDKVAAFGQLLAGVERFSDVLRTPPAPDLNVSSSSFAIEPSGGLDVAMTRQAALRAAFGATVSEPWHSFSWNVPRWRLELGGVYKW